MATFNCGRILSRKILINHRNNYFKCYGHLENQLTNGSASSKGAVVIEEKSDRQLFDSVFPHIVSSVTRCNDYRLKPAIDHFKSAIEHTVPHGRKIRGLLTVAAYRLLTTQPTEEQLMRACIMGWCVEMLQAPMLISDDISDNSITRRGRPCWHRLENVGVSSAVCDILTVESGLYRLLKTYFGEEHYYKDVVNLFHDVTMTTMIGQTLDIWICRENPDFDRFNQANYDTICLNKASLYTFYLPVALAMHMVTIPNKEALGEIEKICLQIGQLYQAKNDYKDCFGDPNIIGKIGNDIEEGKCTWFIVNALNLANDDERNLLMKCYGKRDPELTKQVYDKYVELQLGTLFVKYEQATYDAIKRAIWQLPPTLPTNVLYHCLDTVAGGQPNYETGV